MSDKKASKPNNTVTKHSGTHFRNDNAPTPGYRPAPPPPKTTKKN